MRAVHVWRVWMVGVRAVTVRVVTVRVVTVRVVTVRAVPVSSAGTLQPPRLLHRHPKAGFLLLCTDEFRLQRLCKGVNWL